jgi:adenosylcobyric acid synthase
VEGFGLLDVHTVLTPAKALRTVSGTALGEHFEGYEMHMGETIGPDTARPLALFDDGRRDGAISPDGTVLGTYIHGFLADAGQRHALLTRIGAEGTGRDYRASVDAALDDIAADLERHLDVDALIALTRRARN